MTLQEKIEQCSSFLFFKSHDIQKSPDMCGLLFDNPLVGREAFEEILASTEKSFIRVTFYLLGSTLRLIINGIKNDHIVTVNNLSISGSDHSICLWFYRARDGIAEIFFSQGK